MANELHSSIDLNGGEIEAWAGDTGNSPYNWVLNGDMKLWQDSDARPGSWAGTETRISIAKETTYVKIGSNAIKLTANDAGGAGASVKEYTLNTIHADTWDKLKGKYVTVGFWYKANNVTDVDQQVNISDGTATSTLVLTNDDAWHFGTITRLLSESATYLVIRFYPKFDSLANTTAYIIVDGLCMFEGRKAYRWLPNPRDLIRHHTSSDIMDLSTNTVAPFFSNNRGHTMKIVSGGYHIYTAKSGTPNVQIGKLVGDTPTFDDDYYYTGAVVSDAKGHFEDLTASLLKTDVEDNNAVYGYISATGTGNIAVALELADYY